ncbi:MAG TPA: chloride channel protein [Bacteroidales bacterium]|nr:chloride channel protein [Bacteroidales bacterium]
MTKRSKIDRFLNWRKRNIGDRTFVIIMSVIIGISAGMGAVIIKSLVRYIQRLLTLGFNLEHHTIFYLLLPVLGILATVIFTKYILKQEVGHGIPAVLHAISKSNGKIKGHNMFSSIISSALTVGFGGSVGLEGPAVATGAAIGSNLGKQFRLSYKQVLTMLGCASAAAMAAIFKAPIAGIVFALEVIMLNLSMASLVPLLISSATAVLTSYLFLGQNFLYTFTIRQGFVFGDVPYFILLGVFTGLISVYFTRVYIYIADKFQLIEKWGNRLLIGGLLLGVMIFILPALFGEGYEGINSALAGKYTYLFEESMYYRFNDSVLALVLVLVMLIIMKVVATSVTFASGGVGGIFAPTLFTGAHVGLLFAILLNYLGFEVEASNYVLVAMAGMIAGVIHAPLTSIFLIAEITGGYELFIPLMITSTISYATLRIFVRNSVYTYQLAQRGELITHDKDKAALSLMDVSSLIETNFSTVSPNATLGDLVKIISRSSRNVFPVVDKNNLFLGVVWVNDIRHIVFKPELYDNIYVRELMFMPSPTVTLQESMEDVAYKFQTSSHYNLPVLDNGKYIGFVSRANVFSKYRSMIRNFMEE